MCARITADESRDESLVYVAGGAAGPPKISIEVGDELHMNEHRLRRVTLGACAFDVIANVRNERPAVGPSDSFERDVWVSQSGCFARVTCAANTAVAHHRYRVIGELLIADPIACPKIRSFAMNAPFRVFFVLCFLGVAPVIGQTDNDSPADLSSDLETIRSVHSVPGIVALVLRGDRVIARGAAGVRKQGATNRIPLHDSLHLGSCTKAMTATLAAMLVDAGKLRWSTTLGELFGDSVKDMRPIWRNITVQQALIHRAGFHRGGDRLLGMDEQSIPTDASLVELRRLLVRYHLTREPPEAAPGTQEIYANVDYVVVGAALEKITGRSRKELMYSDIFRKLGINCGGFGAPGTVGGQDAPWGHNRNGEPIDPANPSADLIPFAGPCGNVRMSIDDWARSVALHLHGNPTNPRRRVSLVAAESFDALHRATPGGTWALGWAIGTVDFAPRRTTD